MIRSQVATQRSEQGLHIVRKSHQTTISVRVHSTATLQGNSSTLSGATVADWQLFPWGRCRRSATYATPVEKSAANNNINQATQTPRLDLQIPFPATQNSPKTHHMLTQLKPCLKCKGRGYPNPIFTKSTKNNKSHQNTKDTLTQSQKISPKTKNQTKWARAYERY